VRCADSSLRRCEQSFCPPGSQIERVDVIPSEYGKQRMVRQRSVFDRPRSPSLKPHIFPAHHVSLLD